MDNDRDWTRHCLPRGRRDTRTAAAVGQVMATSMAYGGHLGPETMAQLTERVSDEDSPRLPDWDLHEAARRAALAEIVNAMLALDPTQGWGDGSTASRDGQRGLCPPRGRRRTSRHRRGAVALAFSPFIADNSAPCDAVPIECPARDAPSVLDGRLSQESDLDPQAPDTDTHGSLALNFAALAMFGKRFCPRLRGRHRPWRSRLDPQQASGPLAPLVSPQKRTLHLAWLTAHGARMGQFVAAFAAGQTSASVARKRLRACGPRPHCCRAGRERRRGCKPIGLLDSLTAPARRQRGRQGRLKGEQLQA